MSEAPTVVAVSNCGRSVVLYAVDLRSLLWDFISISDFQSLICLFWR